MSKRDSVITRRALITAGRTLFARKGYDGATIREIGAHAGVNAAMVTYHFEGKQGLFSAILLEDISAMQDGLAAAIPQRASPPERLRDAIRALATVGYRHPETALIIVREQMSGGLNIESEVRGRFFGFFLNTRGIIEEGIRSGDFRSVDSHAVHLSLVGSLIYYLLTMPARETFVQQGGMPSGVPTPDEYVQHVVDLFLRGLRRDMEAEGAAARGCRPAAGA